MRGLPTRYGTHVIAFVVNGVHTFIGPIGLLLRQKRAEAAVALSPASSIPYHGSRIIRAKTLCIVVFWLVVGSGSQVIHRVKVTYITGHADILPPDIEKAQLSQIVD